MKMIYVYIWIIAGWLIGIATGEEFKKRKSSEAKSAAYLYGNQITLIVIYIMTIIFWPVFVIKAIINVFNDHDELTDEEAKEIREELIMFRDKMEDGKAKDALSDLIKKLTK